MKPFRTRLDRTITSLEEAEQFLLELIVNGEAFHPEDDPFDVLWERSKPTTIQLEQLDRLMDAVWHQFRVLDRDTCPCGFMLDHLEPLEAIMSADSEGMEMVRRGVIFQDSELIPILKAEPEYLYHLQGRYM